MAMPLLTANSPPSHRHYCCSNLQGYESTVLAADLPAHAGAVGASLTNHMMSMGQAQPPELVWRMMGTARGRSISRCSDTTREMSCRMSASLRPIIALSFLHSDHGSPGVDLTS